MCSSWQPWRKYKTETVTEQTDSRLKGQKTVSPWSPNACLCGTFPSLLLPDCCFLALWREQQRDCSVRSLVTDRRETRAGRQMCLRGANASRGDFPINGNGKQGYKLSIRSVRVTCSYPWVLFTGVSSSHVTRYTAQWGRCVEQAFVSDQKYS